MNRGTLLAFFGGVALTAAAVVIFSVATPVASAQEGGLSEGSPGGTTDAAFADLKRALVQVRSEIRRPDTLAFYDRLVAFYGLDEGPSDDAVPLPDVARIQHAAVTMPLQEAGKHIKDADLLAFYNRFLTDSGLTLPVPGSASR